MWVALDLVASIGSSNTALAERARRGTAGHGDVLVAEEQTAGRGRRDRGWVAPRYSSAMLSLLVEPTVDRARWGWLPLITALAVTDALAECAEVQARIKWPNDVVLDDSKIAGILSEVVTTARGQGVVVGMGINVDQGPDELPRADSTSIRLAGGIADRPALVAGCLRAWEGWYRRWTESHGASGSLVRAYERRSSTLGRAVRVDLPDGTQLRGVARGIDDDGHLVVAVDGSERVVAAADVVHLRPDEPDGLPR